MAQLKLRNDFIQVKDDSEVVPASVYLDYAGQDRKAEEDRKKKEADAERKRKEDEANTLSGRVSSAVDAVKSGLGIGTPASVMDGKDGATPDQAYTPSAIVAAQGILPVTEAQNTTSQAVPGVPVRADYVAAQQNTEASKPQDMQQADAAQPGIQGRLAQAEQQQGTDVISPAVRQDLQQTDGTDARAQAYDAAATGAEQQAVAAATPQAQGPTELPDYYRAGAQGIVQAAQLPFVLGKITEQAQIGIDNEAKAPVWDPAIRGLAAINDWLGSKQSDAWKRATADNKENRILSPQMADVLSEGLSKAPEKILHTVLNDPVFGEGAHLGPHISSSVLQSLPTSVAMMYPALRTARVAYEAQIAAGASKAEATAASVAAAKVTGSGSEGAIGGVQQWQQTYDQVMALPQAKLESSPAYQAALSAANGDAAVARHHMASQAANVAGATAMAVDSITAYLGDGFLGEAAAGAGRLKTTVHGILQETPTETVQSMGEQFGTNLGLKQFVDPNQRLDDQVMEQGAMGGVTGGLMGAGMAVGGHTTSAAPDPAELAKQNALNAWQTSGLTPSTNPAAQPAPVQGAPVAAPTVDPNAGTLTRGVQAAAVAGHTLGTPEIAAAAGVDVPGADDLVSPAGQPQTTGGGSIEPGAVQAKTDLGTGYVVNSKGQPYKSEVTAQQQLEAKGLQGSHQVVEHEGGYALAPIQQQVQDQSNQQQINQQLQVQGFWG